MSVKPQMSPDSQPYWDGFEEGRVRLPECTACGHVHLPPGPVCPKCFGPDLRWIDASGKGTISTFVVVRRAYFPDFEPPYPVVQAQLAEGPRMTGLMNAADIDRLVIGARVEIDFARAPNGMTLPYFRLIDA
ncbi:Zn-ribbon domain-containing OB-fold protein [Sphingopyxis sp. MC1]|uniref:Zn-ribbon domain-containing OB-fold protein n=1 Tax=Sphingopyxis sp. MC1 TaxID=1174684 RepID=UPI0002D16409|nr:OB-fold domain-containing protein [Sphingopyxis sp. MC1]ENY80186.1 hypothetical protein EBMC1_15534 [Sphingopyxis sp. MC1]